MGFFLEFWKRVQKKGKFGPSGEVDQVVAVDLGQSHLLVLGVEKKMGKVEITHFRLEPRPSSSESISERLRTIFKEEGLDEKKVRFALKGQGVVIRMLTFPQMKREEFASAIGYEVEKYIPFKSSEVVLDFQIFTENIPRGDSQMMEVLLAAVKQSEVYELLRVFQKADLETQLIDIGAFAYANLINFVLPKAKEIPVGFLDMGTETTTLGIVNRGKPVFIREIPFGGTDILKLLQRRLGLEEAAILKGGEGVSPANEEFRAIIEQGLESFLKELRLSLGYYSNNVAGTEPLQLLLVAGGGSRFITDPGYLEREIKVPVHRLEILPRITIHSLVDEGLVKKNEDLLPVALGLCLRP